MPAVEERDPRQTGQTEEEVLLDGGDAGVVLCSPDAGLAVGIVADGYGDVAHGSPLDWVGFWPLFSIVRLWRLIICNHFYGKIIAPDLKIGEILTVVYIERAIHIYKIEEEHHG